METCLSEPCKRQIAYSVPVAIPKTTSHSSGQYSLNKQAFDPTKNTPPNSWTERLENRLENYFSNKDFKLSTV